MSNPLPEANEIERQLRNLTPIQCQILYWVGQGLTYPEVAKKVSFGQDFVQKQMSLIYLTLGLTRRSREEKRRLLVTLICPTHQKMVRDPEKDCAGGVIDATPPKIDPKVENEVKEDVERGLIPLPPTQILILPKPNEPPERERQNAMTTVPPSPVRQNPLPWVLVGILSTFLVVAVCAIFVFLGQQPASVAQRASSAVGGATQPPQVGTGPTVAPSPLPTYTLQPTYTPFPTYTPPPQPSNAPEIKQTFARGQVMFTDSFDRGISPSWKFLSGNWITSNGRLTPQYNGQNYVWLWAEIDQPDWRNYVVSVEVNVPFIGSMVQEPFSIAVRVKDTQPKYLAFSCSRQCGWAFVGTGDAEQIAGLNEHVTEKAVYEIEAVDNLFVARINGREVQRISLTGYESGGIALGTGCNYSQGCPSFGPVKVTAR